MPISLPTETPIPRPPPGPTYVLVPPVELSLRLFIASVIIEFIVLLVIVLRAWSRYYVALRLGWDDALVFVASLFSLGQTVLFGLLVFGGLGHHSDTVPQPNQFSIPKVLFSFELFHIISLNFSKLSALCLFLQLFSNATVAKVTKCCILAVSLGSVGLILWQFLFCHPLFKMWEWDGLENCGDRQPLYLAVCSWSIFTDLVIIAVPLPVIWRLKMDRVRKIRLSGLFVAGLVVTATSIVRLVLITTIDYHDDFSFHSVPATFLAVLEPPETIFCVSLPMMYSLFSRVRADMIRSRNAKTPRFGRHSHTHSSGFGKRPDLQKHDFAPLETTFPDLFEMNDMESNHRQVMVSADRKGQESRIPMRSRTMSVDRDVDLSKGLDTTIEQSLQYESHQQSGGIMVSTDFTVSVSHRE
ncbi:hypothetical protein GGS21DRAFT_373567 [Xylaria nigripes]|nr:hypothetical protein GGS21DRAFT_373567 [Xylaria nigripes]